MRREQEKRLERKTHLEQETGLKEKARLEERTRLRQGTMTSGRVARRIGKAQIGLAQVSAQSSEQTSGME